MTTPRADGSSRAPRFALVAATTLVLLAGWPARARGQASDGWLLHGHDLGGQRYSPLAEIDTANVRGLRPAWTYHSGVTATFQATPIVADGVMYVSLPFSGVVALDAEHWPRTVAVHPRLPRRQAVLRTGQPRGGGGRAARCMSARSTGG